MAEEIEVRAATLAERLETIAENFDLRAHTIAERCDEIEDWEFKMELAQSRAATIREAIQALSATAPASENNDLGSK